MRAITLLTLCICLVGCKPLGKHKAYLYKQPEADGLICVFYSSTPGLAKQNAYIFAEMYEEKFFDTLIVKTKPY